MPNIRWKTPDDRQRNCPKHVECPDKNKLGKISASVGFIKNKTGNIRINVGLYRVHVNIVPVEKQ